MKSLAVAALAVFALVACGQSTRSNTDGGPTSAPTITSFTANPTNLPAGGGSVTLSWNVTGAVSLSISNGPGAVTPVTSGSTPSTVTASTTFTLSATNSSGTSMATATVTVAAGPTAPVINSFTAAPATLASAGTTTLAWDVTGATSLDIDGTSVTPVTSGSAVSSSQSQSGFFILIATNTVGTTLAYATLTIGGDYAPGFVGTYSGIWGYVVNNTYVAPAGSDNVGSVVITEGSINVLGVQTTFDYNPGTFSCTGSFSTVATGPNSFSETAGAGFSCAVTGDTTCGSFNLTATGEFGSGAFDPDISNFPLVILQTYVIASASITACDGLTRTFIFYVTP